ncbi:MAG: hypothetical protein CVU89_11485 [Firmicutes bacterium HGW-Firmicutes-14]|nr:MAG: hypothetical protein CVU89_11485 [Firmicutes bacterium HGW-Firmicutes-14]
MYIRNRYRFIYAVFAAVIFLGSVAIYSVYGGKGPMYKPRTTAGEVDKTIKPTIREDTVIFEEIRYICGDKVKTRIPTTSDLIGLGFSELVGKYPPEAGWSIDDGVENTLVLARLEERVCMYHQDFRHLGISDGFLAVYEGPMGFNQKVLQRDNVNISNLPPEMQEELNMVMDYDNQAPDTQAKLKYSFEFETEAQLNQVLENFDEFGGP